MTLFVTSEQSIPYFLKQSLEPFICQTHCREVGEEALFLVLGIVEGLMSKEFWWHERVLKSEA